MTRKFAPATYPGLAGRTVLNTGGAKGIGYAMAEAFARHGAHLLLMDMDGDALVSAATRLRAAYPDARVETYQGSVTDEADVAAACATCKNAYGSLDILLTNAGISMNQPSINLSLADWRRALDVNLTGAFICAQAAAQLMIAGGGGVILNTASMWGLAASANRAAYCASKAGVISLTEVLADEWAAHGIRVNAICPGYIRSDLTKELIAQGKLDLDAIEKRTPQGRMGTPEEVAEMAVYLASDAAVFITGHAHLSDGGFLARGF
ncbi:SDR family NAD(P)-dependent oxidoreductase [Pseudorhodobacter aquimaris]|uniref:SDR family NAD(P)-dependent oxidoreductase n=1 Tax=Pseudorhodobacter aquimaris TaxID=687412 RepID=UPI00067CBBFC|nr:SDR family oxidoreductase [Pseudorhodobacter aquimaris]